MSPILSFATFIPSQKKQAGGIPRKNQPGLRAVQKISLSWLFSFAESPGGTSAPGLWGGSAQKGIWGGQRVRRAWEERANRLCRGLAGMEGMAQGMASSCWGTPHMPPAGPISMQSLKELDPWAAPLEKMGLLGCSFSGVKGNRGAAKSLLPWGKQQEGGGLWCILRP